MDFDHESVRAGGYRGLRQEVTQRHFGAVAGIDDNGQVGQMFDNRRRKVQGVSVQVSKVRMPLSHKMTWELPVVMMYSAAKIHSSIVAKGRVLTGLVCRFWRLF